ncbi:MAG: dTMP kinase [uncultured bacterium]|nr:MAG: dTMP kinase [uncultured bacterium]HBH18233.1 dTMP kinase [Cyanobacteria bacterium UBA9579]
MRLNKDHNLPGTLIVVEGIDGSGKSTQLALLRDWLTSVIGDVIFTEWNSSKLISETIKEAKKKNILSPRTFSLLHAIDFADRLEQIIVPPLKAGFVVLADRYTYTAFARDVARGVNPNWVRNMYGFSVKPDLSLYFRVPVETSLDRICTSREPKFYEAGMDLHLSTDIYECYKLFQSKVITEYDKMVDEFGLIQIDAEDTIHNQQLLFRDIVRKKLSEKGVIVSPN